VGGNQIEIAITGHPAAGGGVRVRYRLGLNLNPSHPGRGVQIQGRKNQKQQKKIINWVGLKRNKMEFLEI